VLVRGALKSYEHRSDESGRWLKMEFCPKCGTTVTWTRSKQHWVPVPPEIEKHEKSAL
jgi:hypothetical protein